MSDFVRKINEFVTCEVHPVHGEVRYFARMDNGNWVAVVNGDLDPVEVSPVDFESMLETLSSIGAEVRFTNHSAA